MANYEIKDIYQGGFDSLKPNYGDVPTLATVSELGTTTDPRNADILTEVSQKIAPGQKTMELSLVSPEVFESVPENQLKEINRLSKLTGVDVTLHAPVIEPSGVSREGFSETNREATERQMNLAVERAHKLNPDGSSPVTFHSSAILPAEEIVKVKDEAKKEREVRSMLVINSETGSINKIQIKPRHFPGEEITSIQQELNNTNEETWKEQVANFSWRSDVMRHRLKDNEFLKVLAEAEKRDEKELSFEEKKAIAEYNSAKPILYDSYRELKNLCEAAYNNGTSEDKWRLQQFYNQIQSKVQKIQQDPRNKENIKLMNDIVEQGTEVLNQVSTPKIYKPLNEFSKEKTTTTFANVALNSYKKFGDKAPIISIENPPAEAAFATGEDLKNIVEESRKKFVETAMKKEGMSKNQAQKQAEKLIGATWDVGHINMLRKHGFTEKDIIEESKKIAPFVKHVHLSDNFGFEHTELPMGMGNVPIKEIMAKLEEKGFKGKKIVEAAQWWQHFKSSPITETMKAIGSPIYSMEMGPYWNQTTALQQDYMQGLGATLPDVNYGTWGTGFSQLPMELGGQRPGAEGSRMSGRGME